MSIRGSDASSEEDSDDEDLHSSSSSSVPVSPDSDDSDNSRSDAESMDSDEKRKLQSAVNRTKDQIQQAFANVNKQPPPLLPTDGDIDSSERRGDDEDGDTEADIAEWERERQERDGVESSLSLCSPAGE